MEELVTARPPRRGAALVRDPVVWAVAACTFAALALTTYRLGGLSFWVDEGVTEAVSGRGWHRVWSHFVHREPNFGLYYASIKAWGVVGRSEATLRLPSAIAAAATVPVVAALAHRVSGRPSAVAAAVLTAAHASLVRWGQEARPYALAVVFVTLSAWLLLRALATDSVGRWAWWVAAAALACHLHTFGGIAVAAQALAALTRASPRRRPLAATAVVAMAAAPVAVLTLASGAQRVSWIPAPGVHDTAYALEGLTGGAGPAVAAVYAVTAVVGITMVAGVHRVFLAAWLLGPLVFALAASVRQPILQDRYILVCAPALIVLSAAGLARLPVRAAAGPLVAVVVVLSLIQMADWYRGSMKEDWRGAAALVAAGDAAGDTMIVVDGIDVFRYYYVSAPAPDTRVMVLGARDLAARVAGADRIWAVMRGSDSTKSDRVRAIVGAEQRRVVGTWSFSRLEVELWAHATHEE